MNIVAIIQARMSSSRLPGKVLLDIAGKPMLVHCIERTRLAKTINQVVVATTIDPSDDPIEMLCQDRGYLYYRGSLYDVLDRYYQAAKTSNADVIVRITSDCPLIDPYVIDKTVTEFLGIRNYELEVLDQTSGASNTNAGFLIPNSQFAIPYDFAANRLPPPWGRTYPVGLDTEVCTCSALKIAWQEASLPYQREHVMPFFYDQPDRFRILHVNHTEDYGALRWTVDTPEDLQLVREIFARFPNREDFSWLEVLALFEREPDLQKINAQIQPKDYHQVDTRRKG